MLQKLLLKKTRSSPGSSSRHSHSHCHGGDDHDPCSPCPSHLSSTSSAISSIRSSHRPSLYRFSELSLATHNFSPSLSLSPSVWKASLRSSTVAVSRRHGSSPRFHDVLRSVHSLHHSSIVKLLGGCRKGEFLYLVHEFLESSNLEDCLISKHCPRYSALSSWHSRMQIAVDVAKGVEYLHHHCQPTIIHKHLSSRKILVSSDHRAKISDAGVAALTGEIDIFGCPGDQIDATNSIFSSGSYGDDISIGNNRISRGEDPIEHNFSTRSDESLMNVKQNIVVRAQSCISVERYSDVHEWKSSRNFSSVKISGIQGYMPPEYTKLGEVTLKYDVYAFGVILTEILSGKSASRSHLARRTEKKCSLPEMLRNVMANPDPKASLRLLMDPLLQDSYPVNDALKVAAVANSCLDPDPLSRPEMSDVASKLQKCLVSAEKYESEMRSHLELFSSSLRPR